jgi:hypothetical protein
VVRSCRKVWKFPARVAFEVELVELLDEVDEGTGVVPETAGLAVIALVVISVSSYSDVYAAI